MDHLRKSVVIVDGYSTGMFYMPLLEKMKFPVIHVRSTSDSLDAFITEVADESIKRNSAFYSAFIDGTQPIERICEQLKPFNPVAVIPGCETGVELADNIAFSLSLPGNEISYSHARRDKYRMYEAVSEAGVRVLDYGLFDNLPELQEWVKNRNKFPVVIKPVRSAGADGLYICHNMEETAQAFSSVVDSINMFGDRNITVIAQEYACGYEIVVNTVSCKGWHRISDLWRYSKTETFDGRSVYDGVELVSDFGDDTDSVIQYTKSVLDALKITLGAAHTEIMVTSEGPVLIECGARPMGGSFSQDIIRSCLGYTQLEMSLDAYLYPDTFREKWDYPYSLSRYALFKFLSSIRKGALDAVPGVTLLAGLPSVKGGDFLECLESGEVERTVDLQTSPAKLYLCHEDINTLYEDFNLIRELEKEAQNLLFEMSPEKEFNRNPEWFLELPDDLWLKPEEAGKADADTIWNALGLHEGMDILDCPCGDSRVGIHLAKRGANIFGIDVNPRFIQKARQRYADEGLPGEFMVGDMRDLNYENRFDAIINWFNSFGYFDIETDYYVLRLFRKSLRPGGLILIEAPNRSNIIANTRNIVQNDGHELIRRWDELTERLYAPVEVDQDGRKTHVVIGTRMYSIAQYRLLLRLSGFELLSVYDECLNEFGDEAKRVIFVAKKS